MHIQEVACKQVFRRIKQQSKKKKTNTADNTAVPDPYRRPRGHSTFTVLHPTTTDNIYSQLA